MTPRTLPKSSSAPAKPNSNGTASPCKSIGSCTAVTVITIDLRSALHFSASSRSLRHTRSLSQYRAKSFNTKIPFPRIRSMFVSACSGVLRVVQRRSLHPRQPSRDAPRKQRHIQRCRHIQKQLFQPPLFCRLHGDDRVSRIDQQAQLILLALGRSYWLRRSAKCSGNLGEDLSHWPLSSYACDVTPSLANPRLTKPCASFNVK